MDQRSQMADDVNQRIEEALEKLVSIAGNSCNLRKDLKQDLLTSVSILRKELNTLKRQISTVKDEQRKLTEEVKNAKDNMVRRDKQPDRWRHLWTTRSNQQAAERNWCYNRSAEEKSSTQRSLKKMTAKDTGLH
jgi:predicted  nucleic acid-binding Zn-ribbon protein